MLGRLGGQARVPKGTAMMSEEKKREIAMKGVEARRAKRAKTGKVISKAVVLLLLACGASSGEEPPLKTYGAYNCRFWNGMSREMRTGYMLGMADGFSQAFTGVLVKDGPFEVHRGYGSLADLDLIEQYYYPKTLMSYDELANGVTAICRKPANLGLQIANALHLFAIQVNGETSTEIERQAGNMRKIAAAEK